MLKCSEEDISTFKLSTIINLVEVSKYSNAYFIGILKIPSEMNWNEFWTKKEKKKIEDEKFSELQSCHFEVGGGIVSLDRLSPLIQFSVHRKWFYWLF